MLADSKPSRWLPWVAPHPEFEERVDLGGVARRGQSQKQPRDSHRSVRMHATSYQPANADKSILPYLRLSVFICG